MYLLGTTHEVLVEIALAVRQSTHDHMLVLLWHLFLHLLLEASQQEGTNHLQSEENKVVKKLNINHLFEANSIRSIGWDKTTRIRGTS